MGEGLSCHVTLQEECGCGVSDSSSGLLSLVFTFELTSGLGKDRVIQPILEKKKKMAKVVTACPLGYSVTHSHMGL